MKKYFFVAASAALVLSSCSNELEQVSALGENGKKEIKVSTYTPGMTRATLVGDAELKNNGFWLYAVYGDGDVSLLYNHKFDYMSDKWTPVVYEDGEDGEGEWTPFEDKVYWPEASVSFYGVYNGSEETESPIDVHTDKVLSMDLNFMDDTDIMLAKKSTTLTENGSAEVSLTFNHILAEVEVQVKGSDSEYSYELYGISIEGPVAAVYDIKEDKFLYMKTLPEDAVDSVILTTNYEIKGQAVTDGGTKFDPSQYSYREDISIDELSTTEFMSFGDPKIVAPGTSTLYLSYVIKKGDIQYAYEVNKAAEVTLTAGKKNIIQVTLNPGQAPMSISASVAEWEEDEIEKDL